MFCFLRQIAQAVQLLCKQKERDAVVVVAAVVVVGDNGAGSSGGRGFVALSGTALEGGVGDCW